MKPSPVPEYLLGGIISGLSRFIYERDLANIGVKPEVRAGLNWLRTMASTSVTGSESDCSAEELDMDDLIGAKEAAQLLGCSPRWVTEIKADLGGVRPAGGRQIFFLRRSVVEYARAREEHHRDELAKRGNPRN